MSLPGRFGVDYVILAGGNGKRLRSLDNGIDPAADWTPKPLIEIKGKPLIELQMDSVLRTAKVDRIIIAAGYKHDKVKEGIGAEYRGVPIRYSIEERLLGTGGALKKALRLSTAKEFIVSNCDDITDADYAEMVRKHQGSKTVASVMVARARMPFGVVKFHPDGRVSGFSEKPLLDEYVSCGQYVMKREVTKYLPEEGDLERVVFPKMIMDGVLGSYRHEGIWVTVNTVKDAETAGALL